MTLPTTAFGIFALVALLIPGVIYAAVRTSLQGFRAPDRVLGERVIQAILISVGLDAFYLIAFGWWLAPLVKMGSSTVVSHPLELGFAVVVLGLVIPALFGYLRYGNAPAVRALFSVLRARAPRWVEKITPVSGYNAAPTAWDWIAAKQGGKWIRILTDKGRWIGGWYADESFVSLYPEPRDIFLAEQWIMSADGDFVERAANGAGVWLSLESAQLIEWTDPTSPAKEAIDE
jgi:hypothetical protein